MTVIYYLLTFAAGFLFGVFATALTVFSGDKGKRELEVENRVLKAANDELRRQKKELVEKWERLADELNIPKEVLNGLFVQTREQ